MDERVAQEALEALQLEKRLSLLSHGGRPGSGGRATAWAAGKGQRRGGPASPQADLQAFSPLPLVIHLFLAFWSFSHSFLSLLFIHLTRLTMPQTLTLAWA